MKYALSADGGGSKLELLLYDPENLSFVRRAKCGGVNTNFRPKEDVKADVEAAIRSLIPDGADGIEYADVCMLGGVDTLKAVLDERFGRDTKIISHSEGPFSLSASALLTDGILTLSGTGSDVFFVKNAKTIRVIGGWGAVLGDEGSGYDIGLRTARAAIRASGGYGEDTLLLETVKADLGISELWDGLLAVAYRDPDSRRKLASLTLTCERAAELGDRVALSIWEYAGHELAGQTAAMLRRFPDTRDVAVSGGSWKGHGSMFEVFSADIKKEFPDVTVHRPMFEPVMGGVILRSLERGFSRDELLARLGESFRDYRVKGK